MAAKTKVETIEDQILRVTGEKAQGKDEPRKLYLKRLVKAGNNATEADWKKLDEATQQWVNDGVQAANDKEAIPEFPDAEAADEDDEEDAPPANAKPKGKSKEKAEPDDDEDEEDEDDEEEDDSEDKDDDEDDEDEDEEPAPKKGKAGKKAEPDDDEDEEDEDDEEDAPPAKSKGSNGRKSMKDDEDEDDDEDEEPAPKKGKTASSAPAKSDKGEKKPGTVARLREIIVRHPNWSREKVTEQLAKDGYEVSKNTVGAQFYDARNILKLAARFGMLTEKAAAMVTKDEK